MARRRGFVPWRVIGFLVVLAWAMPTLVSVAATALATIVAVPFILAATVVVLAVVVVGVAVAVAVAAGAFALPAWLFWRATRDERRRGGDEAPDEVGATVADREAARLRRRYVSGQISDDHYRDAMLANLKARFASGALDVSEYEAEVGRLVRASSEATPLKELRRKMPPPPRER